jgi:thiosulfate dehydrogenase [quinone] large subunit
MTAIKPRDAALALAITVGFITFQVGADWARGIGALLAFLGLLVVLGAVATLVYDNRATDRLDAPDTVVRQPALARFLFHDTRAAPLWLAVRFYVGFAWLASGYGKATKAGWLDGGAALKGFWTKAVAVDPTTNAGPITYDWYRNVLQYMLDQQWYTWFGKLIVAGELLVGVGILVGGLVGLAAFFGALLNMSFMLAGSASTNPILFTLAVLLLLGWQVAGYWGVDHFLLPVLGAPWNRGRLFGDRPAPLPAPVPQYP